MAPVGQPTCDVLSVLDTSFLMLEGDAIHMHVGGVMVFEGQPPEYADLLEHVDSRLHAVPRYRQKVIFPELELGRPAWVDDPHFALDYHLRHTALPHPGGRDELQQLVGRVFSQRLDRSKPLWEMWLVSGLEGDRFALINKTHHALVDGVSGVDLLAMLMDVSPEPRAAEPATPWQPRPPVTRRGLTRRAAIAVATRPVRVTRRAVSATSRPASAASGLLTATKGIRDLLIGPALRPAPQVDLLNAPIGPHRRVDWLSAELADFKAIKDALGGTVNDVVLAVVTGGVRAMLQERGVDTDGLELRAFVPVSVRTEDQQGEFGNRVAAMRGPLPVWAADPVERLGVVREAMQDLKSSHQAVGAEALASLQEFAPPTILAQASRINFHTRLFNTIVTNVPGPQVPLYLLGHKLEQLIPLGFLAEGHTVFFAIMSYNGRLEIGLLGDRDAMRDIAQLREHLQSALEELKQAARDAAVPG